MFANFGALLSPPNIRPEKKRTFRMNGKGGGGGGISLLFLRFSVFFFFLDFGMCGEVERSDASAAVLFFPLLFSSTDREKRLHFVGKIKKCALEKRESLTSDLRTTQLLQVLAYKFSAFAKLQKNIFLESIFPPVFLSIAV